MALTIVCYDFCSFLGCYFSTISQSHSFLSYRAQHLDPTAKNPAAFVLVFGNPFKSSSLHVSSVSHAHLLSPELCSSSYLLSNQLQGTVPTRIPAYICMFYLKNNLSRIPAMLTVFSPSLPSLERCLCLFGAHVTLSFTL